MQELEEKIKDEIGISYYNQDSRMVIYRYQMGQEYMESGLRSDLMRFIALSYHESVQPVEVLHTICKNSNICLYHICGMCIHPECAWSHDRDFFGLIEKYIKALEKKLIDRIEHPEIYKEVQQWKR